MKTMAITALCVVLVLGFVSMANAQLIAGSEEDKAFTKINEENNPDAKLALLDAFEKQFPQSKVLGDVYAMIISIYQQKSNNAKVTETGEKAIKLDPDNITALMATSRGYALGTPKNLEKANQYAQRAVDAVSKKRAQPTPPQYSDQQWKDYLDGNDQAAKQWLTYVKALR